MQLANGYVLGITRTALDQVLIEVYQDADTASQGLTCADIVCSIEEAKKFADELNTVSKEYS